MRNPSTIPALPTAAPLMPPARYWRAGARPGPGATRPGCSAGAWTLAAGRALSITPRSAGTLRVTGGRLWITIEAPRRGPARQLGDHFLTAGETLELRAGQHAVAEPWSTARFSEVEWEPARASASQQARADLRAAAALAADALRRLLLPAIARRSACC